jgi:hypothetical protein
VSFTTYLKSFKSRWGLAFGVAATVAGVLPLISMAPPWPDEDGKAAFALSTLACVGGVTLGYYAPIKSRKAELRWGMGALAFSANVALAYGYMLSTHVYPFEQVVNGRHETHRVVVGAGVRYPGDANKTKAELIHLYGFDGAAWTENSLAFARLGLLGSYCLFFSAFTFGFGVLQRRGTKGVPKIRRQ